MENTATIQTAMEAKEVVEVVEAKDHANQVALNVLATPSKQTLANQVALMVHANQDQTKDTRNVRQAKASIHVNLTPLDKIASLENQEVNVRVVENQIAKLEKQEINVRVVERIQEKNVLNLRRPNTLAEAILLIRIEILNAALEKIELIAIHRNLRNIAQENLAVPLRAITLAGLTLLTKTANLEKIKLTAKAESQERILEIATLIAQSTVADLTVQTRIDH